jgi:putative ABC transport system permease protein
MKTSQDLRYAIRSLGKAPGLSLLVVLNLALGIAGSTAIFSLLWGVVLSPLPFPQPDRLMRLCEVDETVAGFCVASVPDLADLGARSRSFATVGAGRMSAMLLRTPTGVESVNGVLTTPGFLRALGVKPLRGRLIEESDVNRARVAVLDYGFWQSWAGGDPAVLGRTITLDNQPYTVVGVLPRTTVPELESAKAWIPIPFDPLDKEARGWRGFQGLGRLKPGVDPRSAQREIQTLFAGIAREHPDTHKGWGIRIVSLRDQLVGSVRSTLYLFMAAVLLVLLIACTNVANMLLARAAGRRREIALRTSLGATPGRLVRQLMTESLILAALGGAAGLALSGWGLELFLALAPKGVPRLAEVAINGPVLAFAILLTLSTSLLSGLWPALRAIRVDLVSNLKESATSALGGRASRTRAGLVVAEVALALTLMIGTGLLTRSLATARQWNGGFEHGHLLTLWLLPLDTKYPDKPRVSELYRRAEAEVAALPSVVSAGTASAGPLFGGRETETFLSGAAMDRPVVARWYDVGPRYFQTLGLALKKGRFFDGHDRLEAPRVAIVNETFARRAWPGADPAGQRVQGKEEHKSPMEIVGVVADVKPLTPGGETEPEIYWPYPQEPRWATYLIVRTSSAPEKLAGAVRARLRQIDPDLDVEQVATFEGLMHKHLAGPLFQTTLVDVFALIALALVIGGTYGVLSHTVAQQTREIGVRMALGADRRDIFRQVVGRALGMVGLGILFGLAAAAAVTRLLRGLLYGVAPTDPATFLGMTALLLLVALLAAWIPARRATRIDPLIAIKWE